MLGTVHSPEGQALIAALSLSRLSNWDPVCRVSSPLSDQSRERLGSGVRIPNQLLLSVSERLPEKMTTNGETENNRNVSSHNSGGQKSKIKVSVGRAPSRGSEEEPVPCLSPSFNLRLVINYSPLLP